MEDEVRMLDNRYAILFIRGERPVMDLKYDLLRHPNVNLTEDGGTTPFEHGATNLATAGISILSARATAQVPEFRAFTGETTYELLSEEDFDENKEKEKRRPK